MSRKTYTVAIRMGAAHNDLCELPSRRSLVDLPPPPERSKFDGVAKRRAHDTKLAILTKIGQDLCASYGIAARPNAKRQRKEVQQVPAPERHGVAGVASTGRLAA